MADIAYTRERAIPGKTPKSTMDPHLARYELGRQLAVDLRVLDVCCGAGYGSAMIAETACEVVGFDVDREAIDYARADYGDYVRFEQCDVFDWQEGGFDLVVAFEALEHVRESAAFVKTLYHSLRAKGMVIVSVPSDRICHESPFHVRCFHRSEFEGLMNERFRGWILGQVGNAMHAGMEHPDHWVFIGRKP